MVRHREHWSDGSDGSDRFDQYPDGSDRSDSVPLLVVMGGIPVCCVRHYNFAQLQSHCPLLFVYQENG